jgi:hypothetical protein
MLGAICVFIGDQGLLRNFSILRQEEIFLLSRYVDPILARPPLYVWIGFDRRELGAWR